MRKSWLAITSLLLLTAAPTLAQGTRPRSGVDNLGGTPARPSGVDNLGTGGADDLTLWGTSQLGTAGVDNLPCTGMACGGEGFASPPTTLPVPPPPLPAAAPPSPGPRPLILTPEDALLER